MEIRSNDFFDFLLTKDVSYLYHANSAPTSGSFVRANALLARGVMEERKNLQTPQYTDALDKHLGVYFDVFLDSVDIHERSRRPNQYGPVLFKFAVAGLATMNLPPLWVTKTNPASWTDQTPHNERWFGSLEELKGGFVKGRFEQMIVLRHQGGVLPFDALVEIVVDNPGMKNVDYFLIAASPIWMAQRQTGSKVPLNRRVCASDCNCIKIYSEQFRAEHFY
jgi:hypothetical protein